MNTHINSKSYFILTLAATLALADAARATGSKAPASGSCSLNVSSAHMSSLMSQYVPNGSNGHGAAAAIYVIDPNGDIVQTVYEKNASVRQAIASTQKIVSAWVISKYSDLSRRVAFTNDDLEQDVLGGRATYRSTGKLIQVGDTPTVAQYLNTLITESSNGSALALSRSVNGGTSTFVGLMNSEVDAILKNPNSSSFQNPNGLTVGAGGEDYSDTGSSQGSTANNLARLMGEFMADSTYRSTLSGAGLSGVSSGYLTKIGSTNAAGNTIVFRFPLSGSCSSYGVVAALFGAHVSSQWAGFSNFQTALRKDAGVSLSAAGLTASGVHDPLDFTSQIPKTPGTEF